MSSGSNPVTTMGTWYRSASSGYSSTPITLHTCPAARKACTRQLGDCMIASIAGGTRTCDTSRLKLRMPNLRAWYTVMAFGGAVVSKPMPKKTTCRCGFCWAIRRASSGEYTTRTSPPSLRTRNRSRPVPGTRSMSPKEQKITSGREAISSALSITSSGVTQTGQPGPWINST